MTMLKTTRHIFLRSCTAQLLVASITVYALESSAASVGDAGAEASQAECYPAPDSRQPQYIVGYGSLLEENSRKRTDPDVSTGFPIRVSVTPGAGWREVKKSAPALLI